jgi:hypothetical protein
MLFAQPSVHHLDGRRPQYRQNTPQVGKNKQPGEIHESIRTSSDIQTSDSPPPTLPLPFQRFSFSAFQQWNVEWVVERGVTQRTTDYTESTDFEAVAIPLPFA